MWTEVLTFCTDITGDADDAKKIAVWIVKVVRLPATGIFHRPEMRHGFIVVTDIAQHTNADLLETTQAGDPYSGVLGVIQCRQQHGNENRDDRDHHEHFDQCKLSCIAALHLSLIHI